MRLSRYTLKNIQAGVTSIPAPEIFDLPEKVLQFGTGVLLRALPDYFIDKANKQGVFNGRIVVVKSTEGGDSVSFDKQDGLYTICVRGIENGNKVEENIICSSISRVLSARKEWNKILECAHNPLLQVIISNTTELGIELVNENILSHPPVSFPGKLLAFLYERYKAFSGSRMCGMVIVPTELIPENGRKLESIVLELAYLNGLDETFIDWLENSNRFCNSLVDRIVPGKPGTSIQSGIETELGFEDELITVCEVYRLWAIEGDKEISDILSFSGIDSGIVITEDIGLYRELKLRLLNGTHTISCAAAFLSGFSTVKEAMDDEKLCHFINVLMNTEIASAIPYTIDNKMSENFAARVMERFGNPHIEHKWLDITLQYSSKMRMRIIPVLVQYFQNFGRVPENISTGFAAFLLFMKSVKTEGGICYGLLNGKYYPIRDEKAAYFGEKWKLVEPTALTYSILKDISLWGQDLSLLPGFAELVSEKLEEMMIHGVAAGIELSDRDKIPLYYETKST